MALRILRMTVMLMAGSLSAQTPPSVVTGSVSPTAVEAGGAMQLSHTLAGTPPFSCRWWHDGVPVETTTATGTSAVLTLPAVEPRHAGTWQLEARNAAGAALGRTILVVVRPARRPEIRDQPPTSSSALSIVAEGSTPLSYQWFKNGEPIAGATTRIVVGQTEDGRGRPIPGDFHCVVSNRMGQVVSDVVAVRAEPEAPPAAPVIVREPESRHFRRGERLVIEATVTGTAPWQVQWSKNGVTIAGATGALALRGVPEDEGDYRMTVTNALGAATTQIARLRMEPALPPVIAEHPTVEWGSREGFLRFVAARTEETLTYQWHRDGVPIIGAMARELSLAGLPAGLFHVVVTGAGGSTTSRAVRVAARNRAVLPLIEVQPATVSAAVGARATLRSRGGSAGGIARIEWRRGNVPVGTGSEFSKEFAGGEDGPFTVTYFSQEFGAETSEPVWIVDREAGQTPRILIHPAGGARTSHLETSLRVVADGEGPLRYQWMRGGSPLVGATRAELTLPVFTAAEAGAYTVAVTNRLGTAVSAAAELRVLAPPPLAIRYQPRGGARNVGEAFMTVVSVRGGSDVPYSVQWWRDGAAVPGATGAVLSLAAVRAEDAGVYVAVVRSPAGEEQRTTPIRLGLLGDSARWPFFSIEPADAELRPGQTKTLIADVQPNGFFRWFKDGQPIEGATDRALRILAARAEDAGRYRVEATGAYGTITSREARVNVAGAPVEAGLPEVRALPPGGVRVTTGGVVTLAVEVTGEVPRVQWFRAGVPITGATAPTLTLAIGTLADAGAYHAEITGAAGTYRLPATQVEVTLANEAPQLTYRGSTRWRVLEGGELRFRVTATGRPVPRVSLTRLDGPAPTAGPTATLELGSVTSGPVLTSGTYALTATNAAGTARIEPIEIMVVPDRASGLFLSPNPVRGSAAAAVGPSGSATIWWGRNLPGTELLETSEATVDATGRLRGTFRDPAMPGGVRRVVGTRRGDELTLSVEATDTDLTLRRTGGFGEFADVAGLWRTNWGGVLALTPQGAVATGSRSQGGTTPPGRLVRAGDGAVEIRLEGDATASYRIMPGRDGPVLLGADGSGAVAGVRVAAAPLNRLANLAIRARAADGDARLTAGFVVAGAVARPMLVRAVGPGLANFGVTEAAADPELELLRGTARQAANDNWGGGAVLAGIAARVGAFPLAAGSRDAALVANLTAGSYSTVIGSGAGGGEVLAEVYDVEQTLDARLINLSTLGTVGSGGTLTAGFVVAGGIPKRVLVRAVGPGLAAFGVADRLADPRLAVLGDGWTVAENDDWSADDGNSVRLTAEEVGAFALPDPSRDAGVVATLAPGAYSVAVSGADAAAGRVLIEIYEVP